MVPENDSLCCGCTACEKICPKSAISMKQNAKGFLQPSIDTSVCINCKLCQTVCPINDSITNQENFVQKYIAAKSKNSDIRQNSQSGGAFYVIANRIISTNGIVYGVALNKNLNAVYARIAVLKDLYKLSGSKYVQANVNNVYYQVKNDLENEKNVLFSGTPCHVHGLIKFLKQTKTKTDNLFTIDLICHGVPSPKIYTEYLKLCSKFHNNQIIKNFNFRDKNFGWHGHTATVTFSKSKYTSKGYVDYFYSHLALNDTCYVCKYASFSRISDLTIGDCWGIDKFASYFDDNKGCSLVLINTLKGKNLWSSVENMFETISCKQKQILQHNLQMPTEKADLIDQFWSDYNKYGCEYALTRYCNYNPHEDVLIHQHKSITNRLLNKFKQILRKIHLHILFIIL